MVLAIEDPIEDVDAFMLNTLDFEPDPECDVTTVTCDEAATWRVTCRMCDGWGMLCEQHCRQLHLRQQRENLRRGMRCPACGGEGNDIMKFEPLIYPVSGRLW